MNSGKSCTVFIGNIPYDASEDDLRAIFSRVGSVESLRLVYDKDTRQPKGYGFCDYTDADTALSAIRNLSDVECNGRKLRIDLADNALRSREGGRLGPLPDVRLPVPALPSSLSLPALPAPEPQPRPALPPSSVAPLATPQLTLPMPMGARPLAPPGSGPPGSLPGAPQEPGPNSPEAVIAAVSAHTEIAQTVAAMPPAQLQLVLGNMQRLAKEAPESARALLQDNPQLCYALLHAQLLLGLTLDPSLPPEPQEMQRLRQEASRRPVTHLVPGAGGAVVPPNAPGMPGGPPRPVVPGIAGFPGLMAPRLGVPPGVGLGQRGVLMRAPTRAPIGHMG